MNPNWIILLIGLAGGALPSWWMTSTYYQGVIADNEVERLKSVAEQQTENYEGLVAYAERITKAGADHDKNTRTIRNLARELDGLRVSFPTCPVSDTTEAGADSGGGGRILSDKLDAAFADLQKETGRLIERCDTLNVDAIRANSR